MLKKAMMAAALSVSAVAMSAPATAQIQVPSGLVNVTVGDVILEDILTDIEIDALNDLDLLNDNQIIVQVPIGVAANVCNISAAVLAQGGAGGECTAESGSQALAQAIRRQYLR